jgi:hypothetical protein
VFDGHFFDINLPVNWLLGSYSIVLHLVLLQTAFCPESSVLQDDFTGLCVYLPYICVLFPALFIFSMVLIL